jgi:hypothetical protein
MRKTLIWQAAGQACHRPVVAALAVTAALLSGCAGGSVNSPGAPSDSDSTNRFSQLFDARAQADATTPGTEEPDCPVVKIRGGASTYAVALPGKQPAGSDLRYQATITRAARDCRRSGDQITARIGIQGRIISGPAGAPASVEIPLRVAAVQSGVQEKVLATKVYRTTVAMDASGSVPFSLVGEDLVYAVPPGATSDNYILYIGFDPQALTPEPKPARKKK